MGRETRVFLVAVVGVIVLWFAIGGILPKSWQVETTMTLKAAPQAVLPLLGDYEKWREWTALGTTERANTKVAVEGKPCEPGHQISWRSEANEAVLRLTRCDAQGVEYDFLTRLSGEKDLRAQGHGAIAIAPVDGGCSITWRDSSETVSFTERWFAWFGAQQDAARKFQQMSLGKLRAVTEHN
jgi:hypothetical protein